MPDHNFTYGLLRSYDPNFEGPFTNIDTQERFENNLKTQTCDWEYQNKQVYYKYNSLGHRSVEISDLTNNYLLFTGCSITEGVSLAEEDNYANIVSKSLQKKFYNLAVGGSSPPITVKNLIAFLSLVKNHPSAIIIQWPYFFRYYTVSDGYHTEHLTPFSQESSLYRELLSNNNVFRYNVLERNFLLHYLSNVGYKNKIVEMFAQTNSEFKTICHDMAPEYDTYKFFTPHIIDYARDLAHPGSRTHQLYADKVLEILLEKN